MRTTLSIDDDVLEAAREIAACSGVSIGSALSSLARRGMRPIELKYDADGLPYFDVPSDSPVVTCELVARLMEDFP
jgi:hypothetical protein